MLSQYQVGYLSHWADEVYVILQSRGNKNQSQKQNHISFDNMHVQV